MVATREALQRIENMVQANKGIVTAAEVRSADISPFYLSEMVKGGRLNRLGRGLYAAPTVYVDEMFEMFARNSFIVFSHLSALYLHELTDRTPLRMYITVPRTRNVSRLLETGLVEVKRSNEQTHGLGLIQIPSPSGFMIPVYDMERTICDIVKARKRTDPQILADALRAYAQRRDKDLTRLARFARTLKADGALRPYLEVLL